MLRNDLGPIHRLGRIVLSAGAKQSLSGKDLLDELLLHMRGGREDGECPLPLNCLEGCRLLNVYRSGKGQCFWIINRSRPHRDDRADAGGIVTPCKTP